MRVFTTGQVARMLSFAPRTVNVLFDKEIIKGHRVPLSKDRRVPEASLIKWLKEYDIPLEVAGLKGRDIYTSLLFSENSTLKKMLESQLPTSGLHKLMFAENTFDAGILSNEFLPDVLILDLSVEVEKIKALLKGLNSPDRPEPLLIFTVDTRSHESVRYKQLFSAQTSVERFLMPFDPVLFWERVSTKIHAQRV